MSAVLLGMGNALVDFAAEVMPDQPFYAEIKQNKGGFFHTSEDEFEAMEQELAKGRIIKRSCGGSVANSLKAFAKLGGKAAFVGRIGDDELGAYFAEDLHKFGIRPILNQAMAQRSGCSIVWLDENGEKTICAKRRAAKEFRENWLDWKALAEVLRAACDIAAGYGLSYYLHPCTGSLTETTEGFLRLKEAVGRDNLKFNFDTANQFFVRENLSLGLLKLGSELDYIHISDNHGQRVEHLATGDGAIDWDMFFTTLKRVGVKGQMSIDVGGDESGIEDIDEAY